MHRDLWHGCASYFQTTRIMHKQHKNLSELVIACTGIAALVALFAISIVEMFKTSQAQHNERSVAYIEK
jgi:hypothetical protein